MIYHGKKKNNISTLSKSKLTNKQTNKRMEGVQGREPIARASWSSDWASLAGAASWGLWLVMQPSNMDGFLRWKKHPFFRNAVKPVWQKD